MSAFASLVAADWLGPRFSPHFSGCFLRWAKTPYGGQGHASASVAVGPLSKGKHKVHVYATHSSGVSNLDALRFMRPQPNKKTVAP
jgi:hypothetical protein